MSAWDIVKINDICCKICSGGTPKSSNKEYYDGDIPWLNTNEVDFNNIYKTNRFITEAGLNNSAAKYIPANSIVVAMYGVTAGKCAITKIPLTTNQACCNLIINEHKADYKYVFYYMRTQSKILNNLATGGAQQNLNSLTIKKFKIPLPSVPIQKRIADILSVYDDLIENNNKRIALLEKAAQELYKEWFVRFRFPGHETAKFENGLPKGWGHIRFCDAIEIIDGDRGVNYPKQDEFFDEEHCLFLNAGNVTKTGFDFSSMSFITEEKDNLLRKGKLNRGDVVLTTRGTVGNSAFYNKNVPFEHIRINSGMVILRDLGCVSPEYIYCVLNSTYMLKSMELYASGSAQPQLPIKDMKRIKIIHPDEKTMEAFTKYIQEYYNLVAILVSKNQNLAKQRDLLLPRLMSGKLEA
jgi:type I restriction enzyme S subunit